MPPRWSRLLALLAIAIPVYSQTANWLQLARSSAQLHQQGKYSEATPLAIQAWQAIGSDQTLASAAPPNVSADLTNLGEILLELGAGPGAESVFAKAYDIDVKLHGPQDPSVATDARHRAQAYIVGSHGPEAERWIRLAIDIDSKAFGKDSAEVVRDNGYLGAALCAQRKFGEAQPLFSGTSLAVLVKKLGRDHPDVGFAVYQMGLPHEGLGRAWDAALYFKNALDIDEKTLGAAHPTTAMLRGKLAAALAEQGNDAEAGAEYRKAIDAIGKAFGPSNPQRLRLISEYSMLQLQNPETAQRACLTLRDAVGVLQKTVGPDDPDLATVKRRLSECYRLNRDSSTALKLLNESVAAHTKSLGAGDPAVAEDDLLLARLAEGDGQFEIAERYLEQAFNIDTKALGPAHPKTRAVGFQAALTYFAWKKPDRAEVFFTLSVQALLQDLADRSSYMSEGDRLRFLKTVPDMIPAFFHFAYSYPERAVLTAKAYDLLLRERGFAASSAGAVRAHILASGDKELIARFDALTQKKEELAAVESSPAGDPAAFRDKVAALTKEINRMDEGLAVHSPAFAAKTGISNVGWADIRKALQPGDAAVEFLWFVVPGSKPVKGLYAALVLTRDSAGPKLIPLGDGDKDKATVAQAYQAQLGPTRGITTAPAVAPTAGGTLATKDAYLAFWKPIEPALGNARRVYVATAGVLNQFPIGLFSDEAGKLLSERYDLRLVNSTKDLVEPLSATDSRSAVLMGNPSFDLTEAQQRAAVARLNGADGASAAPTASPVQTLSPNSASASRSVTVLGGKLAELPSTQTEVESVAKQLGASGWQVKSFTGDQALEESLKAQKGPRLLHLATHGFFLPDRPFRRVTAQGEGQTISITDPMLRSGLLFAGADRAEAGAQQAQGLEDGILTAFEATQLNLQGTELVVLSACETGLGDVQNNGEGVFGLRRALQEAGAQSILMSMWSVPDKETQELMTLFYQKWLGGADKHEALRQAQLEERAVVKQRYGKDLPFYWGAFVLVGR